MLCRWSEVVRDVESGVCVCDQERKVVKSFCVCEEEVLFLCRHTTPRSLRFSPMSE